MSAPFQISPGLRALRTAYPPSREVHAALSGATDIDLGRFIRGWLAEGIPFGFREAPAVFEAARDALAARLGVAPRDILLVGSARIGYSLAGPKFGRAFNDSSDLDFAIVSAGLFDRVKADAERWMVAFGSGGEVPINDAERRYWPENKIILGNTLRRCFVDTRLVPNRAKYSWICCANGAIGKVAASLAASTHSRQRRASLRVYGSWEALAAQCSRTLKASVRTAFQGVPGA